MVETDTFVIQKEITIYTLIRICYITYSPIPLPTLDVIDLSNFYQFDEETKASHVFMCISAITCHCMHLSVSLLVGGCCAEVSEEMF